MKKTSMCLIIGIAILGLMSAATVVHAAKEFHSKPFDFLFGNHIDTHQETNLKTKNNTGDPEELFGKFYIIFTGATDPTSGLPVARHPRGLASDDSFDERCGITVDCVTGWEIRGVPGAAKFVSHSGVNGDDHPLWLVNRAEEATAPEAGMVIPQPGSFTHFHWITYDSTDPRADSILPNSECDKKNAGELETLAPSAVDEVCQGWFLQIKAVRTFVFQHGGELIPIRPGIDNRSHLNLLTNFNNDVVITPTR